MSEREDNLGDNAIDPPENTRNEPMNMDSTEESAQAIDPPENTGQRS